MSATTDWMVAVSAVVTAGSALVTATVWLHGRWLGWAAARYAERERSWDGIPLNGINVWNVQLKPPDDAVPDDGRCVTLWLDSVNLAANMRSLVSREHRLARQPTPDEYDLMKSRRKEARS